MRRGRGKGGGMGEEEQDERDRGFVFVFVFFLNMICFWLDLRMHDEGLLRKDNLFLLYKGTSLVV